MFHYARLTVIDGHIQHFFYQCHQFALKIKIRSLVGNNLYQLGVGDIALKEYDISGYICDDMTIFYY